MPIKAVLYLVETLNTVYFLIVIQKNKSKLRNHDQKSCQKLAIKMLFMLSQLYNSYF